MIIFWQLVIPVNLLVYIIFIVVVALYFSLPAKRQITCASTDEERNATSPADIVAYIYKVSSGVSSYLIGFFYLSLVGSHGCFELDRGHLGALLRHCNHQWSQEVRRSGQIRGPRAHPKGHIPTFF